MKKIIALLTVAASLTGCASIQESGKVYTTSQNQIGCINSDTAYEVLGFGNDMKITPQSGDSTNARLTDYFSAHLCKELPAGMQYRIVTTGFRGALYQRVRDARPREAEFVNGQDLWLLWGSDKLVEKD